MTRITLPLLLFALILLALQAATLSAVVGLSHSQPVRVVGVPVSRVRVIQPPEPLRYGWTYAGIRAQINRAAAEFGISGYYLNRIAWCESNDNPNVTNAWSGAAGLFQFMWPTFNGWIHALWWQPGTWLSPYNPRVASRLAAYMISRGQARQWTCAYLTGFIAGVAHHGGSLRPSFCHPPTYRADPACWVRLPNHGRMIAPRRAY